MQGTKSALTHLMERDYAVNTKRRVSLGQILEAGYLRWLLKKKNDIWSESSVMGVDEGEKNSSRLWFCWF